MDFDGLEDKLNLKEDLKKMLDTEEEFKTMLEWRARAQWHYFFQLIERGFNEEQALTLVEDLFKSIG